MANDALTCVVMVGINSLLTPHAAFAVVRSARWRIDEGRGLELVAPFSLYVTAPRPRRGPCRRRAIQTGLRDRARRRRRTTPSAPDRNPVSAPARRCGR